MPEIERSRWEASGRNGYTAIDRFLGDKCQEFLTRFSSKKEADAVVGHLNRAYQLGREEMMKELVWLAKHPGGIFYINQMLMAANDPMDPVTVTRLVSDMADHEQALGIAAEHASEHNVSATWKAMEAGARMSRDLREDSLPYYQPDDEKAFADSYRPGETLCRNHACSARGTPHSHTERDIRSEVVHLPPLPHNPSLGCCAEHFNASPGNPVSP